MVLAALYDIHGNLPALEAVLRDVRAADVERLLIGGDVLPGPMPRECLDVLNALDIPSTFIRGNGDRETTATRQGRMSAIIPEYFRDSIRWNAAQLTDKDERAIASWPLTHTLKLPGVGRVLFCHATPQNDMDIFTAQTAESKLLPILEPLEVDVVVCGHTHMQFDRMVGGTRVVNAGSVGMSFEGEGAFWLLITDRVELKRTDYDREAAAARVRSTRYPLADEFAAKNILTTPIREAMEAAFAGAELKNPD